MGALGKFLARLGPVVAVIRHYLSGEAVQVIKEAAVEAYSRDEWGPGEKTAFIVAKATEFAAATPTPADDLLVQFYALYYARKRAIAAAEEE